MDLCHISLRSDGYESLRDFTQSPQIHATSPLDLSAQIHFGSSGLRDSAISVLKLKPHYNFPGARDLLTSVHLQIDDSRLFDSSGFGCFNASPFPSSRSHDPPTCTLLDLTVQISFGSPTLRASGISSFKLAPS
jgi:hypothetical protein